jgi:hypothetical protein
MEIKELLVLIPENELSFLPSESQVDHQVKKLDGVTMFKLILFSLVHDSSCKSEFYFIFGSEKRRRITSVFVLNALQRV